MLQKVLVTRQVTYAHSRTPTLRLMLRHVLKLPFTATLLHPLCLTDVQTFLRVLLVPRPHLLVRKETIGAIKADMAALKNAGFLGSSSDLMCQPSKRNIIGEQKQNPAYTFEKQIVKSTNS